MGRAKCRSHGIAIAESRSAAHADGGGVGWEMLKVAFHCTRKMVLTQRPCLLRLVEV